MRLLESSHWIALCTKSTTHHVIVCAKVLVLHLLIAESVGLERLLLLLLLLLSSEGVALGETAHATAHHVVLHTATHHIVLLHATEALHLSYHGLEWLLLLLL